MSLRSFLNSTRRQNKREIRLTIEPLDSREAPGSLTTTVGPGMAGQGGPARPGNVAPTITNFRAIVGSNGQVTFSGQVTDDTAVAGYVVRITGSGVNASGIVGRDGMFRITTTVYGIGDITVMAQVTDSDGATSDPVYTTFTLPG